MKKRYYVMFEGDVQGVGFRWTVYQLAKRFNYTGWIRNLSNGNVEMEIQGDYLDIHAFIQQINNASRWISINDYSAKEMPVNTNERVFAVDYY